MNEQQIDFGFVLPHWFYWGWLAVMPIAMIIWCYALEKRQFEKDGTLPDSSEHVDPNAVVYSNKIIRVIDWLSEHSGQFVAFWTITAVVFEPRNRAHVVGNRHLQRLAETPARRSHQVGRFALSDPGPTDALVANRDRQGPRIDIRQNRNPGLPQRLVQR